jgi:hypothetical protein
MEIENIKIIDTNEILNIVAELTGPYRYEIKKEYPEPLFYIDFVERNNGLIVWGKNEMRNSIQYQIVKNRELVNLYNERIEIGKIVLLTAINETSDFIKRYRMYLTKKYIKIGRNRIWKIKKEYINTMNKNIVNKIQYGRTGVIKL